MPNNCEADFYISGPASQKKALLAFIGMAETPPEFDVNLIVPYPEPWRSMDIEREEIEAIGEAARSAVPSALPEADATAEQLQASRYNEAAARKEAVARATDSLIAAYRAKFGTTKDGFNSGGYEWCITHWGSKWGAANAERRDYRGNTIITFQTANSPLRNELIGSLHELFPLLTLRMEYYERGMAFCGGATWSSEYDYEPEDDDPPWRPGVATKIWRREYNGGRGG